MIADMKNTRAKIAAAGLLATAAIVLPACSSSTVEGTAASDIPVTKITPTPVTTSTEPVAKDVPIPSIPRAADRYAELDGVARDAALDNKIMWELATDATLPKLTVVPEGDVRGAHCQTDDPISLAWACDDGTIVYRAAKMDALMTKNGIGPVMAVIAHETAHIGMAANGFGYGETSPREERAANCSAGAYMRRVVEGGSKRGFTSDETSALAAGLKMYPLDGSYIPAEDAKIALQNYRKGYESGKLCLR